MQYLNNMLIRENIPNYVLVIDVSNTGQPYYYTGLFKNNCPENTTDYIRAAKFIFEEEAEVLAINMNKLMYDSKIALSYHVEEHMYV